MIIREFFLHVNNAIGFMQTLPEMKQYSKKIDKYYNKCFNVVLQNNIPLDRLIDVLIEHYDTKSPKQDELKYLINMLVFGLFVNEGISVSEAYNKTIGVFEHNLINIVAKCMLNKDRYFHKIDEDGIKSLSYLRDKI